MEPNSYTDALRRGQQQFADALRTGQQAWSDAMEHLTSTWSQSVQQATHGQAPVDPAVVSAIKSDDNDISFTVDKVGSPVLVKASYFPNWKVSGAKGPYRVTPNLMVVIPTSTHVKLHYGYTPVDGLGYLLTLGGIALAVAFVRYGPVHYDTPQPDVEPADVVDDDDDRISPVEAPSRPPVTVLDRGS